MSSKSTDGSYVKMTTDEIVERCNDIIKEVEEEREWRSNNMIEGKIGEYKFLLKIFPFLKWFGVSADREYAIKKLSLNMWSLYPSIYGYGTMAIARGCRAMAEKSIDGIVFVSRKDFSELFYQEVEE